MPFRCSTGSVELDNVLEELRPGDNVVFYASEPEQYMPFVAALVGHVRAYDIGLVYIRLNGSLDDLVAGLPGLEIVEPNDEETADPSGALRAKLERLGPHAYYLFDPLDDLGPWFHDDDSWREFFLATCPSLFQIRSVAYWCLIRGVLSAPAIAAIQDCTQIFIKVSQVAEDMLITPLKVWGRYSETMFLPHRIRFEDGHLGVIPLPVEVEDQQAYVQTLSEKNRELAEIRDALDHSNQELVQRNKELAELNQRLQEQSRLYQSLRINLDHLVELLKAGQTIGASLSVDQIHRAMVAAALRLFDVPACRLVLTRSDDMEGVQIAQGMPTTWEALSREPATQALREAVCRTQEVRSLSLGGDNKWVYHSVAMGPIVVRGTCLGTLEIYASDARLDQGEVTTLLSYLASEASIALDNAHLYHEVQVQGTQLRSFVENVITTEEQESRRLAFDLHDGLVQLVVASYQHLQTAQAGRAQDPALEEREIEQGVQLLRRAIHEARRLISELRPAGLDDFGLVQALRLYVAQLAADEDWQVTVEVDPQWTALPSVLEAALFRIIQEATTNARKYAEARRVQIRLQTSAEQVGVIIRDWGKGFDLAQVSSAPEKGLHMGLVGIRERARLWGGQCLIKTSPGKGTSIEVYIPWARIRAQEESIR